MIAGEFGSGPLHFSAARKKLAVIVPASLPANVLAVSFFALTLFHTLVSYLVVMADAEGGLRVAQMASAPPYSQAQYAKAPAADLNTNDSGINETEAHAEQGGASPKSSDPSSPSQPPYASPVPLANSPAPNDAQSGVLGLSHGSHASLQGLEPLSPQLQESLDEYMALAVPGTPAPLAPPEPQEDPLRTEGLGLFHVLPDKIILRLLEWLTMESNPAHLYRLMLVSHAFHQVHFTY